jgi:Helix-turn-helix of insertion element transposase
MDKVNKDTGLTPLQEKAVALIVNGKSYSETAMQLKIDRSTLYAWSKKINFQAYYNRLISNVRQDVINELHSFHLEAVKAVRDSLMSENASVKVKVAFWLIEKLENRDIGHSDASAWIKKLCTSDTFDYLHNSTSFDENKYRQLCEDNCLK